MAGRALHQRVSAVRMMFSMWLTDKAVMTVVTLCDRNVTNRHDVTANL